MKIKDIKTADNVSLAEMEYVDCGYVVESVNGGYGYRQLRELMILFAYIDSASQTEKLYEFLNDGSRVEINLKYWFYHKENAIKCATNLMMEQIQNLSK